MGAVERRVVEPAATATATTATNLRRLTMTALELAERLGVSVRTIRDRPPVPPIRIGSRVVFSRAAVDALLGIQTR